MELDKQKIMEEALGVDIITQEQYDMGFDELYGIGILDDYIIKNFIS